MKGMGYMKPHHAHHAETTINYIHSNLNDTKYINVFLNFSKV